MIALGRTKLTCRFVTNAGSPFSMTLWNADAADIARTFEVEESDVDYAENEIGEDEVFVKGSSVGILERF